MSFIPIRTDFKYPDLQRVTIRGVRHYLCPDHGPVPSVTTILDATADKTQLALWEKREGKEKADRIRKEATDLGTILHEHMESHVLGRERPRGNNYMRLMARRMADEMIGRALPQVHEIWGMEAKLRYPGLYAGTADLVGIFNGRPAIMDYKTTRLKLKSFEQIEDYQCQLAAYILSHNELYGTDIKCGVVFMVTREPNYRQYVIEGLDLERATASFLRRCEEYYEMYPTPE